MVVRRFTGMITTMLLLAASLTVSGPVPVGMVAQPSADPDPRTLAAQAAASLVASRPSWLRSSPDDAYVQRGVTNYLDKIQYVGYDRTYRGLPVVGGDFVIVTDIAGTVLTFTTAQIEPISLASITPTITAEQATATARAQVGSARVLNPAELVVLTRVLATPTTPARPTRLAWRTTVAGASINMFTRLSVSVDAFTGALLDREERAARGTGQGWWSGQVPLNTTPTTGGFTLADPVVRNLDCQVPLAGPIVRPLDRFGSGIPTDVVTGCADALYAAQTANRMLTDVLRRDSFDGTGGGLPIRMQQPAQQTPGALDAVYDGTQVLLGRNTGGNWVGALDVVGHEFGHSVDDNTPRPNFGFSKADTHEFVADAFAAATEFFANNPADERDLTVGEEVGPAVRNMANPHLLGHNSCYSPSAASGPGPGNRWFSMVAMNILAPCGVTIPQPPQISPNSVNITVPLQILYGAMLMKTSTSSYPNYRLWTLQVASYLFAHDCNVYRTVQQAWNLVQVPSADPPCLQVPRVNITNSGDQFGVIGVASSAPMSASGSSRFTWRAVGLPPGLSIDRDSGVVSGTPTTIGTYTVTVTATGAAPLPQSGSAQIRWMITDCTGQLLVNPGFESGATAWTASAGVVIPQRDQPPRSGSWAAWLGGYGQVHRAELTQPVTIPGGCRATLSFALHIDTDETAAVAVFDQLTVDLNDDILATYSNTDHAPGYTMRGVDLSHMAGLSADLVFTVLEDASFQTSFVLDDMVLTLDGPARAGSPAAEHRPAAPESTVDSIVKPAAARLTGGSVSDQAWAIRTGDWDGDGKADIGAVSWTGDVRAWASTGDLSGDFRLHRPPVLVDTGWTDDTIFKVLTGDVDGDRRTDLGVVYRNGEMWFWRSTGDLSGDSRLRGQGALVRTGWTSTRTLLADINGDGRDDLGDVDSAGNVNFALSTGDLSQNMRLYPPAVRALTGVTGQRVMTGDVNGDGLEDLIAQSTTNTIMVAISNGPQFLPLVSTPLTGWTTTAFPQIIVGDFNRDSCADLGGVLSTGELRIWSSRCGAAFYSTPVQIDTVPNHRVLVGDVDNNGLDDLYYLSSTGEITVRRATDSLTFDPSVWVETRWTTANKPLIM